MNQTPDKQGKVVIISGPSGVGKSTICRKLLERLDDACPSVSVTTRPKSDAETDGKDYWFVSPEEFNRRIEDKELLEYAEVFGNMYGTPADKVEEAVAAGKTILLEIDVQGARQVKERYPDAVMIFILPPSSKVLAERMNNRGRDAAEAARRRLDGASAEIAAAWQYYNHMVINDDLEQAVSECVQIINSAKTQ